MVEGYSGNLQQTFGPFGPTSEQTASSPSGPALQSVATLQIKVQKPGWSCPASNRQPSASTGSGRHTTSGA